MKRTKLSVQELRYIEDTPSDDKDTKLLACAGSGKTLTLLEKATFLITNEGISAKKIFIFSFSRLAVSELEARCKTNSQYRHLVMQQIETIDSFCYHILKEMGEPVDDVSTLSARLNLLLKEKNERLLNMLTESGSSGKTAKHIFVDEAEDLNATEYNIICALSNIWNARIHLVGDPNEAIYQFMGSHEEFLLEHPGKTFYLTINWRSKPGIVGFSVHFKNYEFEQDPIDSAPQEPEVKLVVSESYERENEAIIKIISALLKKNHMFSDIAVLVPFSGNRYDRGLHRVSNLLDEYSIPRINFEETSIKSTEDKMPIMTIHCSKGLEFKSVIMLGFSDDMMERGGPKCERDNLNLLYVALTRARSNLFIFARKADSLCTIIAKIPSLMYETNEADLVNEYVAKITQQESEIPKMNVCFDPKTANVTTNLLHYKEKPLDNYLVKSILESYGVMKELSVSAFLRSLSAEQKLTIDKQIKYETCVNSIYIVPEKLKHLVHEIKQQREAQLGYMLEFLINYFVQVRKSELNPINGLEMQVNEYFVIVENEQTLAALCSAVQSGTRETNKFVKAHNKEKFDNMLNNDHGSDSDNYIDLGRVSASEILLLGDNEHHIWNAISEYNNLEIPWQDKLKSVLYVQELKFCNESHEQEFIRFSEPSLDAFCELQELFELIYDNYIPQLLKLPCLEYEFSLHEDGMWRGVADFVSIEDTSEDIMPKVTIIDVKAETTLKLDSILQLMLYDILMYSRLNSSYDGTVVNLDDTLLKSETTQNQNEELSSTYVLDSKLFIMNCLTGENTEIIIQDKKSSERVLIDAFLKINRERIKTLRDSNDFSSALNGVV